MDNAYRIAMFEKPLYLAVLTDDLKKALCVFIRYRERSELSVVLLITPHKTFCGENPVVFFLSHGERIYWIAFHAVINGMNQNDIIYSVFFVSSAAEKP